MSFQRVTIIFAVALLAAACNDKPPAPASQPAGNVAAKNTAVPSDTAKLAPKIVKDEPGPDNSRIKVKQMETGEQVEVRTWASGALVKVTRRTDKSNTRTMRVVLRDGKRLQVDDKDAVAGLIQGGHESSPGPYPDHFGARLILENEI